MPLATVFSGESGEGGIRWGRIFKVVLHAVTFGIAVPGFLLVLSCLVEQRLNLARIIAEPLNELAAGILGFPGLGVLAWGMLREWRGQMEQSLPGMPFLWSRARTLGGTFLYCAGIAAWLGSAPMLAMTAFVGLLLLCYAIALRRSHLSRDQLTRRVAVNQELRRFYHQRARERTQDREPEEGEERKEAGSEEE